jgi:hypothetical protein
MIFFSGLNSHTAVYKSVSAINNLLTGNFFDVVKSAADISLNLGFDDGLNLRVHLVFCKYIRRGEAFRQIIYELKAEIYCRNASP